MYVPTYVCMYTSAIKKVARYHKQKWFHDPTNIFLIKLLYYEEKNTQKIPDKENYYLQTNLNQFLQLPAKIYKISVDKPIIILMLPKNGFVLNT